MAAGGRNVRLEEEDVRFRRTASGTLKSEGLVGQFSSKHGIVPIFEGGDSHESKRNSATMKIQHVTRLSDGETRFPKLEECAHFHYDFVELGQLQLQLCEDSEDNYRHCVNEQQDYQFLLRVMSKDKMWNIRRSYENFCMLDKQLHKCIFDRRFSHLPELLDNREMEDIGDEALQELLQTYLERFSAIAGSMIYCGSILNWLEMDNRGNRLLAVDDSGINTPAIAAAHAIRRYTAQAADEISLEVGDIVSVIDMPPAEDTMWWRGKRGFEVGFFPSECVEVIGDKVPHSMASRIPPPSRKPFLRKHSKLISFLQRFFFTRPARNQLKRSGIVKERVFGCDLGEHLLNSGHDVPLVLKCCAEVIQKHGIIDGIYRLSGINSNIQKLRLAFDEDRVPDLTDECYLQDIHSISSLLKMYFRELPNPLLTYQLYDKFAEAVQDEDNKLLRIHDVVQQLPPPHYRTTEYLIRHLARVAAHGHDTGMHSKNLAIVWAPNLLRSKELELGGGVAALQGVSIQAVVTEFLICYADLIFSDKMPSYSSPELRQSQKKPRPKSLAISTPTRLLTLEEARERALASNVPQQRYIDVGGGPEKLPPKYHTVLDLPGYRKKSRDSAIGGASTVKSKKSPVSGWKSFFSKSRSSSIKQKGRKSSFQDPVNLGPMERKAITEEDVKHWKKRRLRSAKSAESLLSLASSHKNSISSTSSSARTSKSGEPGMVVNLYSEKSRKTQHKRSLSSDATTSFVHSKDIIPLYDRTNSEAKELPVDVGTEENNYDGRNGESVDENDVPQLGDSRAQMRQSFIRGDTTRRAIQHRKTASAPSTPMQMNREAERKDREASQEEMRKAVPTESESGRHRLVERVVKSVEFVEPVVTVQEPSRMVSRSEESLVSKLSDNQKSGEEEAMSGDIKAIQSVDAKDGEKSLELRRKQYLESKPQPSETSAEVLKWRAYYSRYHDYAEIDESEVAASDIEVNKKELEILAAAGPEENHSPEKDMKVVAAEVRSPILTSTLWSDIAKLEDGISPLSYLQSEMSKCLSVPSDIGKSLENVNIGSQSDLMSAVSISELSQSVDSISVNDPDLDIAQFGSGLLQPAGAESKMETTLKELNLEIDRAFKREPDDALRVEQSKLFSHIPSSVVSEVLPLENLPLSDAQFSHMITTVPLSNSETDFLQRQTDKTYSAFGLPSEMKQMTTSLSDSCMASDAARMDSDLQHSYHHQSGAAENKQPFFITELASTEFSEDFSQMLKLYAPDEVEKMMAESDDYWAQSGHRSQSHDIFLPQVSVEVPLLSSSLPHLNPIQYLPIQTVKSELPAPVGSRPLCIVPDQHDPPVGTDLNVVIQQNVLERNAGKRKCEILSCKSSSTGSMENIPSKSPRSMSSLNHEDLLTRSAPVGHSQGWLESDLTQDTPTSAPGSMSLPAVSPQKDLVAAVSASLQYHQTSPRTSPEVVMASELPVNVDSWHCQMSSGSYLTAQTENKYTDSAILPSPMFMQWNRENMAPLCEDGTTPLPQLLSSGSYVAEDDPNLIPAPPPSPLTVSMSSDSLHFSQTDSQRQADNCDTLIPVICETSPAHQELIENRPVLKKSKTDSFLQQAPWNLSSESWLFPTQPLEVVVERQQIVCSQKGNKEGETLNRSQGSMQENQTFLNEVPLPRPTTSSSSSSSSSAAAKLGTHLKEVVNQFGILSECVIKSYSMDSSHPAFYSHSAANQQQPGFSLQQESHAKPFPTVSDGRRKILESWPPRRETIIEIRPTIKDAQKKLCLRTHSARTFSEMGGRRPTEKCGVLSKSMHEVGAQSSDMSTIQVVSSDDVDLVKTRSLDSLLPPVVESKRSGQHSSSRTRVSAGWIAPESPIPHPAHWSESGRTPHIPKLVPSVDAEISDSVFADDEKDNQIINKCIAGVARCFKDSLSNRSSLDESVLQVAAERHHAFDSFNTSIPTDRYNSGSLQKPRKLQNLKEFFEIAEHRNRQLAKFQGSDGKPRKHHSEDNAMQAEPKPITASTGRIFHHRSRSRERGKKNQGRQPASRSPTPSSRKPAALEKWQRAESQEREGKRWDMGVDYVYSKQKVKSESPALSGTAAKPPRYCSSPRARTCSESSTSDGEVMRSPPAQRSVEVRCIGLGLDSSKVVKRFPEQSKNDTSDSECKFLTSDLEGSGDEPLTSNLKRKGSIKELRNFFEGKQQDAVFRESRTDLASSPRKFSRPRVKSLSPVCGQSETKSDDEISHRGNVRFSLDFSRYTSAPHVEGIINKQPVRLGPMPFYGTKT